MFKPVLKSQLKLNLFKLIMPNKRTKLETQWTITSGLNWVSKVQVLVLETLKIDSNRNSKLKDFKWLKRLKLIINLSLGHVNPKITFLTLFDRAKWGLSSKGTNHRLYLFLNILPGDSILPSDLFYFSLTDLHGILQSSRSFQYNF